MLLDFHQPGDKALLLGTLQPLPHRVPPFIVKTVLEPKRPTVRQSSMSGVRYFALVVSFLSDRAVKNRKPGRQQTSSYDAYVKSSTSVRPKVAISTEPVRQSRSKSRNSCRLAIFQATTTKRPASAGRGMKLAKGDATSMKIRR